MAWKIKAAESVEHAVRRLACKAMRRASAALAQPETSGAVHRARKEIRKVRALTRATIDKLRLPHRPRLRRRLRAAAHALAPARDAYVDWQTLRHLEPAGHDNTSESAGPILAWALERRWIASSESFDPKPVCRDLGRALHLARHLRLRHSGRGALASGIHDAYCRAREAVPPMGSPSPEALHRWRKRTKDLVILLKLIVPRSPDEIGALAADLATLVRQLGDVHDLSQLRRWLSHPGLSGKPGPEIHRLIVRLARRERELAGAAVNLGRSLFRPTGAEFDAWLSAHGMRATT